ncbi:MAG: glycosyltransferase family 2 protein [Bacteroidetes bacterium]|nr:glycosyltransferase family 2 protein [Bacteroidota bacterium]
MNNKHIKNSCFPSDKDSLSIVVPLYNEEESLVQLSANIIKEVEPVFEYWEVIFVDDGSTDKSFDVIREIIKKDNRFKCIRFRRNFGKSAALNTGFSSCNGNFIATMDADLQDDPKEFKQMYEILNAGYDLVSGWKKKRYDPISKTIPSKFFNYMTSKTSGIRLHDFNCGIKMYRDVVVESLDVYGEMHRYLPALAHWNGFKVTECVVEHHKRQFGKSKFGLSRFIRGFLDLLTVTFTTRYMKRPMHFFGIWGTIFTLIGLTVFGILSIEWLLGEVALSGRPLAWASLGLVIIGIQLFSIGIIGEMIVKQNTTKNKQTYLIKETIL